MRTDTSYCGIGVHKMVFLARQKIFWTSQTQRAPGEHYRCVADRITLFKNSEQAGLTVVAVQNPQEKRYVFMVNPGKANLSDVLLLFWAK